MSKNNKQNTAARAGMFLRVEQGEYSDYCVLGSFVVLQDFDPNEKLEEYFKEKPKKRDQYSFDTDEFLAFLLKQGLLLEVKYGTLFLGTYGTAEDFKFTRP